MSLAQQFESLDKTELSEYVSTGRAEDLTLEFKTVNRSGLDRDDRKNLAIAISGFANSGGGLLVWGIVGRVNDDNIDCATAFQEIDNLPLFISKLNEFTGAATNPSVDGVRHKDIPAGASRGYAVTLVPESDSGPHMAKLGGDRYYKRSGASFYK